ncbi:MAG: DUF1576 domain-containing protein [Clostridiales bacterium]|nr:DUF1576 domain-containing protein [Clostridiales bacterium]
MAKTFVSKKQNNIYNIKHKNTFNNFENERTRYIVVLSYITFMLISSFVFNKPNEIIWGMKNIVQSPSILITDYMAVGNIGSAIFNSSILMLISTFIVYKSKSCMTGPVVAGIFTVGGFALFGKNIYNVWSIILGLYLYTKARNEEFNKYILIALFGTALSPVISKITFDLGLSLIKGIILANLFGISIGFVLVPLASHFANFHQGFNLYNLGFTAGVVGTICMSILRGFGFESQSVLVVAEGYNIILGIYLGILFVSMIILGFLFNNKSFKGYNNILDNSGRATTDYIKSNGFALTLINMGLLGIIATIYVLMVRGELNGPTMGGILTIVGFGCFGKHVKNVVPVMIGVYMATLLLIWDTNSTGALLAALFGTTLAPIAGEYGWKNGVIAGFLHTAVVMNTGFLHGGMNLYNNGFSGGLIAATLVPIINSLKRKR